MPDHPDGAIAQLGERLHGMQEVSGSIPLSSTKFPALNSDSLKHFRSPSQSVLQPLEVAPDNRSAKYLLTVHRSVDRVL